jgi:hypothetical protein
MLCITRQRKDLIKMPKEKKKKRKIKSGGEKAN